MMVDVFPVTLQSAQISRISPVQPLVQPIDDILIHNRFEFPRKVQLLSLGRHQSGIVGGSKVIRGTAAPVYHVTVLALAPEGAFPVGDVKVVVDVGETVNGVSEDGVEE